MSLFFTQCIYAALVIWFIHATTWEGMIFGFVRKKLYHFPVWIKKPLYLCVICMSPWYAVGCWFLFGNVISLDILYFALIVGGINTIASLLIPDHELETDI